VIGEAGAPIIFKQLPTAAILPDVHCVLPAGSYIRVDLLFEEIRLSKLPPERLLIDPNAVVITDREIAEEKSSSLRAEIGSTESGTGAAVVARIRRKSEVKLARDEYQLREFVRPTTPFVRERLQRKQRVIVEGTQGFGLSALHSSHYPFATSRDTTAAGFVSESGLSPLDVDDVVLVIRAFPIRVAGNSGPLANELTWHEIAQQAGSAKPIEEFTSVTRRLRRVAKFDPTIVRQAIGANAPTRVVLNHIDHVDLRCAETNSLTLEGDRFVRWVEEATSVGITLVGFGPHSLVEAPVGVTRSFQAIGG
jgi:adenylosuccinate synthase